MSRATRVARPGPRLVAIYSSHGRPESGQKPETVSVSNRDTNPADLPDVQRENRRRLARIAKQRRQWRRKAVQP